MTALLILFDVVRNVIVIPVAGWTGAKLWGWFIVPLGVPPVSLWHAAGLAAFAALMVMHVPPHRERSAGEIISEGVYRAVYVVMQCGLLLLVGWALAGLMA